MLLNLKQLYVALKEWELAYKAVDLMLLIEPGLATEIRDRGLLAYRLNRLQDAIFGVRQYLLLAPDQADAGWLREHLAKMEYELTRLN
jgi:regulator of sirC expression with transglutaminase-like and TPR domain